ncbi:YcxB family protein [Cohnella pontilimi]|nr:YcxB family protein [Cohnella pontilimi]
MSETVQASTVGIELTKKDILDFNFSFWRKNGTLWIMLFFGFVILLAVMAEIADGRPFQDYVSFLVFLLIIILMPFLMYFSAKRSFNNKFLQEKKTYVFTPEGFTATSASTSVNTLWTDVQKVQMTKNTVLLFIASNAAHILPRRYLTGHPEIYTMIQQYIPKESRKKGKSRWLRNVVFYMVIFLVTVAIVQFMLSRQ